MIIDRAVQDREQSYRLWKIKRFIFQSEKKYCISNLSVARLCSSEARSQKTPTMGGLYCSQNVKEKTLFTFYRVPTWSSSLSQKTSDPCFLKLLLSANFKHYILLGQHHRGDLLHHWSFSGYPSGGSSDLNTWQPWTMVISFIHTRL